MAKTEIILGEGGGGSIKTGTLSVNAVSTEYTIDTGLGSALKRFTLVGIQRTYHEISQFVLWDSNTPTKYSSAFTNTNSGGGTGDDIFKSASAASYFVVSDVTNGVIKVKSPTNSTFANCDFIWYAE